MSRLARMVAPGLPHHVTQRGNRREAIFFEDGDQQIYCDLLAEQARKFSVEVWAYCLMPNHVHLILTPHGEDGMSRALGEAHRRYTNFINARGRWTGHLFQSRFASVAMDKSHLRSAVSYVSLDPVRARLVSRAQAEGIGRPLGTADFVTELERRLRRPIARRVPGRKAAAIPVGEQLNLLQ
jgi:putative transposase